jgi:phosphoribosylformimino-5-aminoimidazole carboxamide ribotide isomerase
MHLIPVVDLQCGVVVRGIGGRRHEYRPVVSRLTSSCDPLDVACAFREHLGLTELYLADLDAIAGAAPALDTYRALQSLGFRLWVDAGAREATAVPSLLAAGVANVVLGLETLRSPQELAAACGLYGRRIIFSLDLVNSVPRANRPGWGHGDAATIAAAAVGAGVQRLLILDLAHVGEGRGTGTEELCKELSRAYPDVELAAGGGIRGRGDLDRLRQCGVTAALVASALHDGALRREEIEAVFGAMGSAPPLHRR